MRDITWTDMLICVVVLAVGVGVIVVTAVTVGVDVVVGKFFLTLWCIVWPLVFAKMKWFGEEPKERKRSNVRGL